MQVVADPAAPPHFLFVGFRAQPGGMGPVGEQVGVLALRQRVRLDGSLDNSQAVLVTDEPYAGRGPSGPFRYESDLATNKPEPDVIAVDDLAALGIVPADLDANPGLVTAVPFGTVEINRGAGFGAPINISFGWRLRTAGLRVGLAGLATGDPNALDVFDPVNADLPAQFRNAFFNGGPILGAAHFAAGDQIRMDDGGTPRTVTIPPASALSATRDGAPLDPPLTLVPLVDTVVFDRGAGHFALTWRASFLWDPRFDDATLEIA